VRTPDAASLSASQKRDFSHGRCACRVFSLLSEFRVERPSLLSCCRRLARRRRKRILPVSQLPARWVAETRRRRRTHRQCLRLWRARATRFLCGVCRDTTRAFGASFAKPPSSASTPSAPRRANGSAPTFRVDCMSSSATRRPVQRGEKVAGDSSF
ncbi:hypothetical protein TGARI_209112, partial [Toxoplasma gondii ARI]